MQRQELLSRLKALKLPGWVTAFEEGPPPGTAGRGLARAPAGGGKRRPAGARYPLPQGLS
jgi:hypothetical protein